MEYKYQIGSTIRVMVSGVILHLCHFKTGQKVECFLQIGRSVFVLSKGVQGIWYFMVKKGAEVKHKGLDLPILQGFDPHWSLD